MTSEQSKAIPMNHPELHEANGKRTATAAARTVEQAWAAISVIDNLQPTDVERRFLTALRARFDNPDASLAQIAAKLDITKDTYSALLRRALKYAEKIGPAQKHGDVA